MLSIRKGCDNDFCFLKNAHELFQGLASEFHFIMIQ
jgi:hypothetical protein